jgi:DNA polymerase II large subunit
LRYSFGINSWRLEEIKQIDRKTRKMLTMYKMHHPKADIDRLHVNKKVGERGLVQVEAAYKTEIINVAEYLNTKYKGDQFVTMSKS